MDHTDEVVKINENNDRKYLNLPNAIRPGFIAPDGGWGWMVVVAAGMSNYLCVSLSVCFGLIFLERFQQLGINASQTTTILNMHIAISAAVGLANGPLFRKYSYRQVACVGGFVSAISICALSFMNTFYGILFFYSIVFGCSKTIVMSANILAVITYFKKKLRIAVGLTWTCAGLGLIINPQLTTKLMSIYGSPGTVLIFGGFMLNIIACALVFQSVEMHAKKSTKYESIETAAKDENIKMSNVTILSRKPTFETYPKGQVVITNSSVYTCDDVNNDVNTDCLIGEASTVTHQEQEPEKRPWYTYVFHSVVVFFDLDLLRDYVFVNLMLGVSIAWFTTLNFVYLTPYILSDYYLRDFEIASVMSVFAAVDVFTRAFIPFLATYVGWGNRTFFLIGIGCLALFRIVLAHLKTYSMVMVVAVFCGIGKALTIVFLTLVIPAHVSLEKLPSANGLQLVTQGLLFLAFGPVIGWIRDTWGNYVIVLHVLNVFSYLTIISWVLEIWYYSRKRQQM